MTSIDILEDHINSLSPDLLRTLLVDHSTGKNIIWATNDYSTRGAGYNFDDPITPDLITALNGYVIQPRVIKTKEEQKNRVRGMAEVFTPSWICNAQNNIIDAQFFGSNDVFNTENPDHKWTPNTDKITFPEGKSWQDYVLQTRLEITCGEAPYLCSRYDTTTGEPIEIIARIGILDRKLRVISENTDDYSDWIIWVGKAYQNVYGFEYQGDSLLIARENLLITFVDYFQQKFHKDPEVDLMLAIAKIISWNVWQMDGLKGVVPNTCHETETASLFGDSTKTECPGCKNNDIRAHNGVYSLIFDWEKSEKIRYLDLLK